MEPTGEEPKHARLLLVGSSAPHYIARHRRELRVLESLEVETNRKGRTLGTLCLPLLPDERESRVVLTTLPQTVGGRSVPASSSNQCGAQKQPTSARCMVVRRY